MNLAHSGSRSRCWSALRDEAGSATAELTLLTPLLIILLLFVVFCGRLAHSSLQMQDAAHQASRAASLARTTSAAQVDARATAQASLAKAGLSCRDLSVVVNTAGLRPGSTISVDLSCTVGLSDLALLGVPGSKTLTASFSSPVDVYRSGPVSPGIDHAAGGGG